nr:His/Gly/Thr/Pro-type tRNA ligase C-terminal domain-containing protein [Methanoculleus sp.]
VDHDTLEDNTVTIRDRDSTKQVRVPIERLPATLSGLVTGSVKFHELKA